VATGSPFSPVTISGGKVIIPSQCNNMYIFPGIGLAASISGIRKITDTMLIRAGNRDWKLCVTPDFELISFFDFSSSLQ
jgi:malic enzyme